MPLSHRIARFNRRVTNRVTGLIADRAPGFAIVHHTGRRSGRAFSTPVTAFRAGDDYIIALTYGSDADWVKNVLAADGCEIVTRGQRIRLAHPRVISDARMVWAPLPIRLVLRAIHAPQYLRLTWV
jgi:deazaflavin-dependent oxidoreductase (nitroreductase family)